MYAVTAYLTLHQMAWLNSKSPENPIKKITLHLQTEGSNRYIPRMSSFFVGSSAGHGVIPWMKLNGKISIAINKEQRRKSATCQLLRRRLALLTAHGAPGAHSQLAWRQRQVAPWSQELKTKGNGFLTVTAAQWPSQVTRIAPYLHGKAVKADLKS